MYMIKIDVDKMKVTKPHDCKYQNRDSITKTGLINHYCYQTVRRKINKASIDSRIGLHMIRGT